MYFTHTTSLLGIYPKNWSYVFAANPLAKPPEVNGLYKIFRFAFKLKNLIDLASLLPYYISSYVITAGGSSQGLRILRILRVVRVLRLFRLLSFFKAVDVALDVILFTMKQSMLLLSVFAFLLLIVVVLFGSIIYICEHGTFTVNQTYPYGAFLRPTADSAEMEISPFESIAVGIYWAIGTIVGSG